LREEIYYFEMTFFHKLYEHVVKKISHTQSFENIISLGTLCFGELLKSMKFIVD